MTFLIQTALFLLGMCLCVQWVAALFGIIDRRYANKPHHPATIANIFLWTAIVVGVAQMAGSNYRPAFLWGVAVFPVFYVAFHAGTKALMTLKARG